jgi:hypothetical protein
VRAASLALLLASCARPVPVEAVDPPPPVEEGDDDTERGTCRSTGVDDCPEPFDCGCCPLEGGRLRCLCTTPCEEDDDCPSTNRPRCFLREDADVGICVPAALACAP